MKIRDVAYDAIYPHASHRFSKGRLWPPTPTTNDSKLYYYNDTITEDEIDELLSEVGSDRECVYCRE